MSLNLLKQSISNKTKIESKVKSLEIETAKLQRELSILSQELDEERIKLEKLENNKLLSIFSNHANKMINQQEKVRIIRRKYNSVKYNYDLLRNDLNNQTLLLNEIYNNEKKYEQELDYQISLLNNKEYDQIKSDNQHYLLTIHEGEKIIECLKKMDLYYTRGGNYQTIDKRYTLGNTKWVMGNPRVDVYNLKKEIYKFEDLLKEIKYAELINDIEIYFKYSNDFFKNILNIAGLELTRNNFYPIKVIDFKRDVSNVLNKLRIVYGNNLVREKELRKQLEAYILKN